MKVGSRSSNEGFVPRSRVTAANDRSAGGLVQAGLRRFLQGGILMIRESFNVAIAAAGVVVFSGLIAGCGSAPPVAVVPPPPPPPAVVVEAPPPPPPVAKLVAPCDSEIRTGGHIHFPYEVEFDIGKATIKTTDKTTHILQCLADFLNNTKMVTKFRVEGYTDNAGDATMNQTLSENRALAVTSWLTSHGVTTNVWGKGFGPQRPVAPNDTPEHMAMNRRVEFHIDELNGTKATHEAIQLAMNPPAAAVVTTTAVVGVPTVGVAVPTVGVAVPTVGVGIAAPKVAVPTVGVGVAVPTVGVGVGVGGSAPATTKKDDKKDKK
jgi:outer membrane protein OmpA-like peptidoglycan-associated protein